jgi:ribosomal protein S12 methylthiotransferase
VEAGTTAHPLGDPVPEAIKEERKSVLLEIQREISRAKLAGFAGRSFDVLVEGLHPETDLLLRGRHQGQAPEVDGEVFITEGTWRPGDIIPVTIEETFDYDMAGRVVGGIEV